MSAKTGPVDTNGWSINTHGSVGYSRGCRCEICRAARAASSRARRAAARARREAAEAAGKVYIAQGITHGTISGYRNSGCRCPKCCQAKASYRKGEYKPPAAPVAPPPSCRRCKTVAPDGPCCSTHSALLCHRCYRLTHFVGRCVEGCAACAREGLDPMTWPDRAKVGAA